MFRVSYKRDKGEDRGEVFDRGEDKDCSGLRENESIVTICKREGVSPNLYYRWNKDFLEAGKKRLTEDPQSEASSDEVAEYKR